MLANLFSSSKYNNLLYVKKKIIKILRTERVVQRIVYLGKLGFLPCSQEEDQDIK